MNKRSPTPQIKVGLVQINTGFSGQDYFPYSVGILQAYAQQHLQQPHRFFFGLPVYKRTAVDHAVAQLGDNDLVFFSAYTWNMRISTAIAEQLKRCNRRTLVIFGGPEVPDDVAPFLRQHPYIDIAVHGEGEQPFVEILEGFANGNWQNAPAISYRGSAGELISNPRAPRVKELDRVPSPYLSGVFEPLMAANPGEQWIGLLETNRGCPYSCAFCDWGSATASKLYRFDLQRVKDEIAWLGRNGVGYVFCCDANFGILERDIEIAQHVADVKARHGAPEGFSVQNAKNSSERSFTINKILSDHGLNKGVTLALQSVNEETLESIKRRNISHKDFARLQAKLRSANIGTYTDVILALPNETYTSFKDGVTKIIEDGQHDRIQFNNLSLLPNAEMSKPEYMEKYGFVVRETRVINAHGASTLGDDEIFETQKLVVGTKTMPTGDWIKTRVYSWMTNFLYFDKLLQIPLLTLSKLTPIKVGEAIEYFADHAQSPLIGRARQLFRNTALAILDGEPEYCESKRWLNIWWPADELQLIELCTEGRIDTFYVECQTAIERLMRQRHVELPPGLLADAFRLNRALLKLPAGKGAQTEVALRYDLWSFYHAALRGEQAALSRTPVFYRIDHGDKTPRDWQNWCREVVWWGNKKGAYLSRCERQSLSAPQMQSLTARPSLP